MPNSKLTRPSTWPVDPALVLIVSIYIVLKAFWFFFVAQHAPLYGDQNGYVYRSDFLVDCIKSLFGQSVGLESDGKLFGKSRVLGQSLLLVPIRLLTDSAAWGRIYMGAIDVGLLIANSVLIARLTTYASARIFASLYIVLPMIWSMSFSFWGDFTAGNLGLLTILLACLFANGEGKVFAKGLIVGLLCAVVFFFRPNTLLLGPMIFAFWAILVAEHGSEWRTFGPKIARLAIAFMVGFSILYVPWVAASSAATGKLFVYPSQGFNKGQALNLTIWRLTPPGVNWGYQRSDRYYEDVERRTAEEDIGKREVKRRLVDEVLKHSTFSTMASAWWRNLLNLVRNENQFLAGQMWQAGAESDSVARSIPVKRPYTGGGHMVPNYYNPKSPVLKATLWWNSFVYYIVLLLSIAYFALPEIRAGQDRLRIFLLAGTPALLLMPFAHPGHGRYIFVVLPLMILAAALHVTRINKNVRHRLSLARAESFFATEVIAMSPSLLMFVLALIALLVT